MMELLAEAKPFLPIVNTCINVWVLQKLYSLVGKVGRVEGKMTVICQLNDDFRSEDENGT